MATQVMHEKAMEEKRTAETVLGGSLAESIVGVAALILTIIGLSGFSPARILPIATIAVGVAFLFEGGAITMRFSKLLSETASDRLERTEFGVGLTSEYLGGIAGVVLGILALLGVFPMYLVPAAVLVYGATLMMSSALTARLDALDIEGMEGSARFKKIAHEAVNAMAGVDFVLGLVSVILGIIAISGTFAGTLSLAALLIVSCSIFLTGTAVTTKMISLFRR